MKHQSIVIKNIETNHIVFTIKADKSIDYQVGVDDHDMLLVKKKGSSLVYFTGPSSSFYVCVEEIDQDEDEKR